MCERQCYSVTSLAMLHQCKSPLYILENIQCSGHLFLSYSLYSDLLLIVILALLLFE